MAGEELVGPVPLEWEYTTLGAACERGGGDIQTGPFGSQLHASDYVPAGIPSIMPQNIGDNRIIEDDIARITQADAQRLGRYLVRKGDIVCSRRGDVERRALVREREDGWLCGTGCLRVRLGEKGVDPRYAAFYLGHPSVREWVVRHAHGATMPNLNTSILAACPFLVPPKNEQHAIAHILGTLDDKIELNRRMNETLETMARAVFKSWFVDFDPVRAKAEGRDPGLPQIIADLFPDSFVDSELGEIPEGWKVGTLRMLGELAIGGDWGEDEAFAGAVEAICLRGVDLEHLRCYGHASPPRRWFKPTSLERRAMDDRDVLVAGSGAGPTGRPLWMCAGLLQSLGPCVYSNFCKRIRCGSSAKAVYLDAWLHGMRESGEIWEYVNGTSVPNLDANSLLVGKEVPIPTMPVLDKYRDFVCPIWQKKYAGENNTLAALRDTILPKLISGELRVKDAERFLGRVG